MCVCVGECVRAKRVRQVEQGRVRCRFQSFFKQSGLVLVCEIIVVILGERARICMYAILRNRGESE